MKTRMIQDNFSSDSQDSKETQMKSSFVVLLTALVIMVLAISSFSQVQDSVAEGTIVAPPSTLQKGLHTPLYIFIPKESQTPNSPPPNAENPGSIACIYDVTANTPGCPISGSPVATGGTKAIAVVVYGNNSTLQADFNTFNAEYGLPAQTLQFICSCSSCPSSNGTGWDLEVALDTEYAHAMAPNAQIIVSEFCTDPFQEVPGAETLAGQAVAAQGGGEVSNSFSYGTPENSIELTWDVYMTQPTVVYFAAAGDNGIGPTYPSVSPNVVSAGGTHIHRGINPYPDQYCWGGSGGGTSQFETIPTYQTSTNTLGQIQVITNNFRGTPDWGADADPSTGVAVYSTTGCTGWCQVGGTSVASPVLAGMTNAAGTFAANTGVELTTTYHYYKKALQPWLTDFLDVYNGTGIYRNGYAGSYTGWDECTGLGAPKVLTAF